MKNVSLEIFHRSLYTAKTGNTFAFPVLIVNCYNYRLYKQELPAIPARSECPGIHFYSSVFSFSVLSITSSGFGRRCSLTLSIRFLVDSITVYLAYSSETEERKMITNVVDFGDSLAKDIMVPKMDVEFANIDLSYDELIECYSKEKYTRLPVYNDSRDDILGIINLKDVFFYQGNKEASLY